MTLKCMNWNIKTHNFAIISTNSNPILDYRLQFINLSLLTLNIINFKNKSCEETRICIWKYKEMFNSMQKVSFKYKINLKEKLHF